MLPARPYLIPRDGMREFAEHACGRLIGTRIRQNSACVFYVPGVFVWICLSGQGISLRCISAILHSAVDVGVWNVNAGDESTTLEPFPCSPTVEMGARFQARS